MRTILIRLLLFLCCLFLVGGLLACDPEPGDSCDVEDLGHEICSDDAVLQCGENTDGALVWHLEEVCDISEVCVEEGWDADCERP